MTAALEAVLRACKARDTEIEGIPMLLALEDLAAPASAEPAPLLRDYLASLAADPRAPSLAELALAQEVAAAVGFGPAEAVEPLLRAINFHSTPSAQIPRYEAQLGQVAAQFETIDEAAVDRLLSGVPQPGTRAPLVAVFYEGYRNHYDVALPLLERHGLHGWFVVPTAFIDAPVTEQRAVAEACNIDLVPDEHGDGRYAMTWDELREISDRGHVVCCHTASHCGIADVRTETDVQREIVASRARLEAKLGREVTTIAFLWGSPYGVAPLVDAAVTAAGYRRWISNTKIQRLPPV